MNAFQYIFHKQYLWARRHKLALIGSQNERGRRAYTRGYEKNLFQPLLPQVVDDFNNADGGELHGHPPKMAAIHSSSALGVNVFHYWLQNRRIPDIAAACGFCRNANKTSKNIRFEQKFSISDKFRFSPNIDVVIENEPTSLYKAFAVECKFSEAYSSQGHGGLKDRYLDFKGPWDDYPHLFQLALRLCPQDDKFRHLHPAQLVKHILGLTRTYGKGRFRLMYLWYDVLGEAGVRHASEIEEFRAVTKADGIKFHAMSYQELIIKLPRVIGRGHEEYLGYLSERYL